VKISKARELEQVGNMQEAIETLSDAVKTYPGTQAAIEAATLMTGLASKAEVQDKLRQRTARDLLVLAREDYRAGRYYDCLQRCEQLSLFPETAEAKEGSTLAADVKANPERLAAMCDQMNQRTASMYLTLGDSWAAKGQVSEAITAYEKVLKLHPNSRAGDAAAAQISKLKGNSGGIPAALAKPNP
jgi:tetratricopeptide (TPR) repeat protein